MKIEVDTKNDSKEEIKHAIKLLMEATNTNDKEVFSTEPEPEKGPMSDLVNLFGDNSKKEDESKVDDDGYLSIFSENEEKEEATQQAQDSNPLANFFGSSEPATKSADESTDEDDNDNEDDPEKEEEREFFKTYEDEEDKKKPRISFY